MKKFWELMEESVIIQSTVTLLVTIIWGLLMTAPLYMPVCADGSPFQVPVAAEVWAIIGIIYGYWFGTKKDMSHRRELQEQVKVMERMLDRLK